MWEKLIIQKQIDPYLLEDIQDQLGNALSADIQVVLSNHYHHPKELKPLRQVLKSLKPLLSADLYRQLSQSVRQISEDLKFSCTDRGKTVLTLNRWLEPWYQAEIKDQPDFADILIGGHSEKDFLILVTGKLPSAASAEKLRHIIATHMPPYEIDYQLFFDRDTEASPI